MATAADFLRDLQRSVEAEQAAPRELSDEQKALCGEWHWCGGTSISLPADSAGMGAAGTVTRYAMTYRVTTQMILNSFDRNGHSDFVTLLADEDEQLSRFGEIVTRRGLWPANVLPYRPGSVESVEAAAEAKRRAWLLPDGDVRTAELSRLRKLFAGDYFGPEARSRTLAKDLGGDGRDALLRPGHD